MRARWLAVLALLLVTGCARYWAKPGGTPEAFNDAKSRCTNEAFARYPAVRQTSVIEPELIAPKPDLCVAAVKGVSCMTNGGQFPAPTFSTAGMTPPARQMFAACMANAGWQPVRNTAEGDAVTRGYSPIHGG